MSEQSNANQGRLYAAVGSPSHSHLTSPHLASKTLGTACLILALASVGLTFWTSDLAVQSSATVAGLKLCG